MSGYRPMMDRLFKSILSIREFKIRVDDDYTDRYVKRVKWCKNVFPQSDFLISDLASPTPMRDLHVN